TATFPTRPDRCSASCALSTTTRTARRSTTGGVLIGSAENQRPSARARAGPTSTAAPATDPSRTKSRRVRVVLIPSRSMARPPRQPGVGFVNDTQPLRPSLKCREAIGGQGAAAAPPEPFLKVTFL